MRAHDTRSCEAGIEDGNPKFGWESHQAELDMDSASEPTLELPSFWPGLAELKSLPQKGTDVEPRGYLRRAVALSLRIPADSGVLRSTSNENQERDNFVKALMASAVSRLSAACLGEAGLPQKPMPSGKPRDTLTEARQCGR